MSSIAPVRYAVVGLGHIAQVAVLPAFAHARRNSKLVAVVSDDRTKRREITRRYRLEHAFSYEQFEDCLNEVDAVYIALPNSMHAEYTVRAAKAGVHVLVRKADGRHRPGVPADDHRVPQRSRQAHDRVPSAFRNAEHLGNGAGTSRSAWRAEILHIVVLDDGPSR